MTPTGRVSATVVQLRTVASPLAETTDDERRYAPRHRVLKAGIAAFNGRFCTVSCTVRDISDTGARLRSDGSVNVPDTFDLIIEIDGFEASCQVAWRRGNELGVHFTAPPKWGSPKRDQVVKATAPTAAPSLRRKPIK